MSFHSINVVRTICDTCNRSKGWGGEDAQWDIYTNDGKTYHRCPRCIEAGKVLVLPPRQL